MGDDVVRCGLHTRFWTKYFFKERYSRKKCFSIYI